MRLDGEPGSLSLHAGRDDSPGAFPVSELVLIDLEPWQPEPEDVRTRIRDTLRSALKKY
ncbi:MAG: hypothetical protein P9M08_01975 [Candidatus Erginobacter occultus]|nr:hypothetical protein [Candidatus Erginobacter occultus]